MYDVQLNTIDPYLNNYNQTQMRLSTRKTPQNAWT